MSHKSAAVWAKHIKKHATFTVYRVWSRNACKAFRMLDTIHMSFQHPCQKPRYVEVSKRSRAPPPSLYHRLGTEPRTDRSTALFSCCLRCPQPLEYPLDDLFGRMPSLSDGALKALHQPHTLENPKPEPQAPTPTPKPEAPDLKP